MAIVDLQQAMKVNKSAVEHSSVIFWTYSVHFCIIFRIPRNRMLLQTLCTLNELLWLSSVHPGTLWVTTLKQIMIYTI